MKTRTPKEELRFDIEVATGGKGVYTWELVEEIMQAIERHEQQVKSVDLADVVVPKGKLCDHAFKHLKFVRDRQIVCKCGERFSY